MHDVLQSLRAFLFVRLWFIYIIFCYYYNKSFGWFDPSLSEICGCITTTNLNCFEKGCAESLISSKQNSKACLSSPQELQMTIYLILLYSRNEIHSSLYFKQRMKCIANAMRLYVHSSQGSLVATITLLENELANGTGHFIVFVCV